MNMQKRKYKLSHLSHEKQVKCSCCKGYYKQLRGFCEDQAHQCASYLYLLHEITPGDESKSYIRCEYGSGFDTSLFNIVDEIIINQQHIIFNRNRKQRENKYKRADDRELLVCDKCIEKFIISGAIKQDMDYEAFKLNDEIQEIQFAPRELTDEEVKTMWKEFPDFFQNK